MPRIVLTDKLALTLPAGRYWDQHPKAPRGFLLDVTPKEARAYRLNYRNRDGVERRFTIGDVGTWSLSEARKRAAELRRIIDAGSDPLGEARQQRAAPTVRELIERYIAEELPKRAPRTQQDYRAVIDGFVLPALGTKKVIAVTRDDCSKLHRDKTAVGHKVRANRVLTVMRLLFRHAILWGARAEGDNPATMIKRNAEPPHERYLTDDEIPRLNASLEHHRAKPEPHWADSCLMITTLMLTGARRGEVVGMRWGQLDLDAGTWTKPQPLTKQRKLHRIPLSPEMVASLRPRRDEYEQQRVVSLQRDDRVFRGGAVVERLQRDWRVIRAHAGLDDVRLHDLRHTYASLLAGSGLSLPIIGALLGHSQAQTTQRYAHLADRPLREATGIVGKIVGPGKAL